MIAKLITNYKIEKESSVAGEDQEMEDKSDQVDTKLI